MTLPKIYTFNQYYYQSDASKIWTASRRLTVKTTNYKAPAIQIDLKQQITKAISFPVGSKVHRYILRDNRPNQQLQ